MPVLRLLLVLACACQNLEVSRAVGARCDESAECDDRCLEPSVDWPGGFCTLTCDTDDDCPNDAACIDELGGGACTFRCFDDASCRFLGTDYECTLRAAEEAGAPMVMVCRG